MGDPVRFIRSIANGSLSLECGDWRITRDGLSPSLAIALLDEIDRLLSETSDAGERVAQLEAEVNLWAGLCAKKSVRAFDATERAENAEVEAERLQDGAVSLHDRLEAAISRAETAEAKLASAAIEIETEIAFQLERALCDGQMAADLFVTENRAVLRKIIAAALDGTRDSQPAAEQPIRDLVSRFAAALLEKLTASEAKYGWSNGWLRSDWSDKCRSDMQRHIEKGDPRDVAAYCAFMWHHGWSTSNQQQGDAP